jgi:hypothetical protein
MIRGFMEEQRFYYDEENYFTREQYEAFLRRVKDEPAKPNELSPSENWLWHYYIQTLKRTY